MSFILPSLSPLAKGSEPPGPGAPSPVAPDTDWPVTKATEGRVGHTEPGLWALTGVVESRSRAQCSVPAHCPLLTFRANVGRRRS